MGHIVLCVVDTPAPWLDRVAVPAASMGNAHFSAASSCGSRVSAGVRLQWSRASGIDHASEIYISDRFRACPANPRFVQLLVHHQTMAPSDVLAGLFGNHDDFACVVDTVCERRRQRTLVSPRAIFAGGVVLDLFCGCILNWLGDAIISSQNAADDVACADCTNADIWTHRVVILSLDLKMVEQPTAGRAESLPSDARTEWLIRYESWLKTLARLEIDSRFQGKFSASDAVQQTLLEAWKDWDGFRGTEEPQRLAWLRQILAHQLAHLARHYAGTQKRDVSREVSMQDSLAKSSDRLAGMLPTDISTPSIQAAAREQQLRLAEVLQKLPDDYREVIVLRNLQELPHAEVARRMDRKEGAVRMLWVRALKKLREEMDKG